MQDTQMVHGIDPLKLAKYFVQVCRRGNRHEARPTKIEGLKIVDKDQGFIVYNGGQVWTRYTMASIEIWLGAMLKEAGVLKQNPQEKWSQFVSIVEIESDADKNIIRIRYSIKHRMDFLDSKDPSRSIWTR